MFRQTQIALKTATTPFVISAEADCLYPPDYFQYIPLKLDVCYRNSNIFVLKRGRDHFNQKKTGGFAQVIGREFYLNRLNELFGDNAPEWDANDRKWPNAPRKLFESWEYFKTENPCLSLKTEYGMRRTTVSYTHLTLPTILLV